MPDFEANVIMPPPACPYSALNPLVSTVNSVSASTEGVLSAASSVSPERFVPTL